MLMFLSICGAGEKKTKASEIRLNLQQGNNVGNNFKEASIFKNDLKELKELNVSKIW